MPRRLRCASGGYVFHALNRAVGRAALFKNAGDYVAFMKVLRQAKEWQPMRLLAFASCPITGICGQESNPTAGLAARTLVTRATIDAR